ncbi:MAG: chorismate mutase [Firmicutes bacterium]|jgi:chorismate mutase/prephenate dehydratase|nr:chorismate mutase [Bacillota bacterium]
MNLSDYRQEIDRIDREMVRLFTERMDIASDIGRYKKENGLPVHDPQREQEKLASLAGQTREEFRPYVEGLYSAIFELSRAWQEKNQ